MITTYQRYIPITHATPSIATGAGKGSFSAVKSIPTISPVPSERSNDRIECISCIILIM